MMALASKADLARGLYDAYKKQDRPRVELLLADDFAFTSPYDDAIDRAAYFKRCWPTSEHISGMEIEKIAELDNDVFVQYKVFAKTGKQFRNVETLTFDGQRIRAVNVYFGATFKDGKFVKQPEPA